MQIHRCAWPSHFLHTHLTVARLTRRTAHHKTIPSRATRLVHSVDFPRVRRLYLIQFLQAFKSTVFVFLEHALLDRIQSLGLYFLAP